MSAKLCIERPKTEKMPDIRTPDGRWVRLDMTGAIHPSRVVFGIRAIWPVELDQVWVAEWLAQRNKNNRRVKKTHVETLEKLLDNGEFRGNHPHRIIFDEDGNLVTGQHRLIALLNWMKRTGRTFVVEIETGCDPDLRPHTDGGVSQSIADRTGCTLQFAAIINFFKWVGDKTYHKSRKLTPAEHLEIYEKHKESIDWAMKVFGTGKRYVGRVPVMVAAAEFYERDQDKANEFVAALLDDSGHSTIQQARKLRDYLLTSAMRGMAGGAATFDFYSKSVSAMKNYMAQTEIVRLNGQKW